MVKVEEFNSPHEDIFYYPYAFQRYLFLNVWGVRPHEDILYYPHAFLRYFFFIECNVPFNKTQFISWWCLLVEGIITTFHYISVGNAPRLNDQITYCDSATKEKLINTNRNGNRERKMRGINGSARIENKLKGEEAVALQ